MIRGGARRDIRHPDDRTTAEMLSWRARTAFLLSSDHPERAPSNNNFLMSFSVRVKHRPIHFYQDETCYFVTLRTIGHVRYFGDVGNDSISAVVRKNTISGVVRDVRNDISDDSRNAVIPDGITRKRAVSGVIRKAADKFGVKIFAWAILDNHIHLLFLLPDGSTLPGFIHNINANISRIINKMDNSAGRKFFRSYWDYCVRNEKDFFMHFNYIHHNPVKHGYVGTQRECREYEFCSYKDWVKKNGEEWALSVFERYPIIDFTVGR